MADRPATSSVQHATAAYGHLLDVIVDPSGPARDRARTVESMLGFAEAARELSGYQWEDLAEHLRARYVEVPEDDAEDTAVDVDPRQEGQVPAIQDVPELHNQQPRPIRDAPQA